MSPTRRPTRAARAVARLLSDAALYVTIFLFLAVQTAAASAQHAHDALVRGGQGDPAWLPWTLAGTPELLAILGTLEYSDRRKRHGEDADVRVPFAVIVGSALVLMGAQLVTAQRTALGLFTAAWPALAFLVALALIKTRPRAAAVAVPAQRPAARPAVSPAASGDGGPVPGPAGDATPDAAAVAALDPNARAVYAALTEPEPGRTMTPAEIQAATGLGKDAAYRATKRLVAARLVHATTDPSGYATRRRMEAVA